jgi:hypothetical protein
MCFFINHLNIRVPKTINNYDKILIGLCVINQESFEIRFWKPMLQHGLIKLCPHDLLSLSVLKLHVTNCNGHHFTINKIIHMISHSCLTSNMLHMIKDDPSIL